MIEETIAVTQKTKNCPYCGEEILAVADKCKHCGEMIPGEKVSLNKKSSNKPKFYLVVLVLVVVFAVMQLVAKE